MSATGPSHSLRPFSFLGPCFLRHHILTACLFFFFSVFLSLLELERDMIQTCEQRETQRAQGRAPSHALWAILHVTQAVPCGRLFRFRIGFIVEVALQYFLHQKQNKKKKKKEGECLRHWWRSSMRNVTHTQSCSSPGIWLIQ